MARDGAVFGGEHSAHYYFRDFWFADTGMLAAMHVLAALGEQEEPLSAGSRPHTAVCRLGRDQLAVTDAAAATEGVRDWAPPGRGVDELDGLTVTQPGPGRRRCGG